MGLNDYLNEIKLLREELAKTENLEEKVRIQNLIVLLQKRILEQEKSSGDKGSLDGYEQINS